MKNSACSPVGSNHGFTLIELMIVVAVVAILASIAYPSYREHIIKTRRTAATSCIGEYAQFMERFYTTNLRYDQDSSGTAFVAPNLECSAQQSDFYAINIPAVAARTYTISAVPTTRQNDAKCGTLTQDQAGVKSRSGSAPLNECFK